MDLTSLIDLYFWLSGTVPAPLMLGLLLAFGGASAVTNFLPTPPRPEPGDSLSAHLKFWGYRACDVLAWVGKNAKQRPDEARAIISAVNRLRGGLRGGSGFTESSGALDDIVKAAQDLAGKPVSRPTNSGSRTGLSIAFALLLAGSILLPGCASITGGATPENALADARFALSMVKQAADVYPTMPDHDKKTAEAMTAAVKTLDAAITNAHGALDRGEDWRMPALQAAVSVGVTEAWKWVYTHRVVITEPVPASAASSTADAR